MPVRTLPSLVFSISTLAVALPAFGQADAQLGRIDFSVTSNGSTSPVQVSLDELNNSSIPVEVSFTTTTSGALGSNRGAAIIYFRMDTHLPLIDQVEMTMSHGFTNDANVVSSTPGAGFDLFVDDGFPTDSGEGDPNRDAIDGAGGSQALIPKFTQGTMGAQGENLEFAGHFAPIQMATVDILIHKDTPIGTYDITLTGLGTNVWNHDPGDGTNGRGPHARPVLWTTNTLQLIIVPEPITLVLLVPVGFAVFRRR